MSPKILLEDEKTIFSEVDKYLNIFNNSPYIFNLGHGLLPKQTQTYLKSYRKSKLIQMKTDHPKVNYGKTGVLLVNLGLLTQLVG